MAVGKVEFGPAALAEKVEALVLGMAALALTESVARLPARQAATGFGRAALAEKVVLQVVKVFLRLVLPVVFPAVVPHLR